MKDNKYFKFLIKLQFLFIIPILNSCSSLQPPSIRSYNFKEKGDVCVAATIGANYEFQAAYSPLKHVYLQAGYRHSKINNLGLYWDYYLYQSKQIGFGYYNQINSNSNFQFGTELFDGKGDFKRFIGGGLTAYETSAIYFKGIALNCVYTNYRVNQNYGFIIGGRIGLTKNAEMLLETPLTLHKYRLGVLEDRVYNYYEGCFSIYREFKKLGTLSLNSDICVTNYNNLSYYNHGSFRISLSYQITFNTRKKNRVN